MKISLNPKRFFRSAANFFDKYGGRNGTESNSNYNNMSYGGYALGDNYSNYSSNGVVVEGREYNGYTPPGNRGSYEVTGNTRTQFQGGKISRTNSNMYETPSGNMVYYADYDAGMGFLERNKSVQNGPLTRHNVQMNNGTGNYHNYHTYDANYTGQYARAKESIDKEWREIANSDKGYNFTAWDMESILNSNGITQYRDKNKMLNVFRININRTPSITEMTSFSKQYIFFSKPDLNLFTGKGIEVNPSIVQHAPDLHMRILKNLGVARSLQISFGGINRGSGGGLINILTNYCNSADFPEMTLSQKEGPSNVRGTRMTYGGDFQEATGNNSINISFLDNRDRDITALHEIWTEYIEATANGSVNKKDIYIAHDTIDYAINIYYFTLDESYNIIQHGMVGGCYPLTMNTEMLTYTALPRGAEELAGPFQFQWHVSFVFKPNSHRIIEMFNWCTGFTNYIKIPESDGPHKYMWKKIGDWYIHNGFTPYNSVLAKGYEFHFNLEDKWAELVGVSLNMPTSGTVQYSLVFASRNVGTPKKPGDFAKREFDFYKFDDDISENVKNWSRWKEMHPNYFTNPTNREIYGFGLSNQEYFDPNYQAWLRLYGGKTFDERFRNGYTSANNRFGSFRSMGSNSDFFEQTAGKVLKAFRKLF